MEKKLITFVIFLFLNFIFCGCFQSDIDGDGYYNNEDDFPNDVNEWIDSDKDGYGDNSDEFPNDSSLYLKRILDKRYTEFRVNDTCCNPIKYFPDKKYISITCDVKYVCWEILDYYYKGNDNFTYDSKNLIFILKTPYEDYVYTCFDIWNSSKLIKIEINETNYGDWMFCIYYKDIISDFFIYHELYYLK